MTGIVRSQHVIFKIADLFFSPFLHKLKNEMTIDFEHK